MLFLELLSTNKTAEFYSSAASSQGIDGIFLFHACREIYQQNETENLTSKSLEQLIETSDACSTKEIV